jgi:hypothetical protein
MESRPELQNDNQSNLLSNLLPILPKINIHLYQQLSSMANVLPTEEGMLISMQHHSTHLSRNRAQKKKFFDTKISISL